MSLARMVDAALNRAGEGLRTLEDLARFVLNDAALSGACKHLRHDLREAAGGLWPGRAMIWSRDTSGDVGTAHRTSGESGRGGAGDLAAAAGTRACEAMRTLEEAAKLDAAEAACAIEAQRYRAYDLAADIERRLGAAPTPQWRLCLLLTAAACRRDWQDTLAAAIAGGVDAIQIREKDVPDAALIEQVRAAKSICDPHGVAVIVNDRVDVALLAGADGAHLGQGDLPITQARRLCGRRLWLGATAHGASEARAAVKAGADYVGIGPICASTTKPELSPAGLDVLREVLPCIGPLPHLAIGGLTPASMAGVVSVGGCGAAVGAAISAAEDPEAAARACLDAILGAVA
ncbi:MAG: thiamine phosphate synthase [Phycisphaerales bacterium]|nr:thiamine phosphate synthase [Phycisphaerales bacterium]